MHFVAQKIYLLFPKTSFTFAKHYFRASIKQGRIGEGKKYCARHIATYKPLWLQVMVILASRPSDISLPLNFLVLNMLRYDV